MPLRTFIKPCCVPHSLWPQARLGSTSHPSTHKVDMTLFCPGIKVVEWNSPGCQRRWVTTDLQANSEHSRICLHRICICLLSQWGEHCWRALFISRPYKHLSHCQARLLNRPCISKAPKTFWIYYLTKINDRQTRCGVRWVLIISDSFLCPSSNQVLYQANNSGENVLAGTQSE